RGAGDGVALCEERRRQMELKAVVAGELTVQSCRECAVSVQPGYLVFVLVGEQLEVVPGNRFGESAHPRCTCLLDTADLVDKRAIALGIGGVLVIGQERHA